VHEPWLEESLFEKLARRYILASKMPCRDAQKISWVSRKCTYFQVFSDVKHEFAVFMQVGQRKRVRGYEGVARSGYCLMIL